MENIYILPVTYASKYNNIILQIRNIDETAKFLNECSNLNIHYFQIVTPAEDWNALPRLIGEAPVDLVLKNPAEEYPLLYHFSQFPNLRCSILIKPNFFRAVKVAASLHFPIQLTIGKEDISLEEMEDVLQFYLTSPSLTEPIEFFHSYLYACYHNIKPQTTLWELHEATEQYKTVDNKGNIILRCTPKAVDCKNCMHFPFCQGYCKQYNSDCNVMKSIFDKIIVSSQELQKNFLNRND